MNVFVVFQPQFYSHATNLVPKAAMDAAPFDVDADLLYGDLPEFMDTTAQQSQRTKVLEEHVNQLRAQVVTVTKQVRQTRHLHERMFNSFPQKDELAEENQVLLRNISILYKTAMAELDRKNATIKDLHAQYACYCATPWHPQPPHRLAVHGARNHRTHRENRPPLGRELQSRDEGTHRKRRRSSSRERGVAQHRHEPRSYHVGRCSPRR